MKYIAKFFKDAGGRLRCNLNGHKFPAEGRGGTHRYNFCKVAGLPLSARYAIPNDTLWQLSCAEDGDIIEWEDKSRL